MVPPRDTTGTRSTLHAKQTKASADVLTHGIDKLLARFDALEARMAARDRRRDSFTLQRIHDIDPPDDFDDDMDTDFLGSRVRNRGYKACAPLIFNHNRGGEGQSRHGVFYDTHRRPLERDFPRHHRPPSRVQQLRQQPLTCWDRQSRYAADADNDYRDSRRTTCWDPPHRRHRAHHARSEQPKEHRTHGDLDTDFRGTRQATYWGFPQRRNCYPHARWDQPKDIKIEAPRFDHPDASDGIDEVHHYSDLLWPAADRLHYDGKYEEDVVMKSGNETTDGGSNSIGSFDSTAELRALETEIRESEIRHDHVDLPEEEEHVRVLHVVEHWKISPAQGSCGNLGADLVSSFQNGKLDMGYICNTPAAFDFTEGKLAPNWNGMGPYVIENHSKKIGVAFGKDLVQKFKQNSIFTGGKLLDNEFVSRVKVHELILKRQTPLFVLWVFDPGGGLLRHVCCFVIPTLRTR